MKTWIMAIGVMAGVLCFAVEESAELQRARAAAVELGDSLKGRLMAAVEQGDLTHALAVCQTAAPEIADDISGRLGVTVRRTSEKLRNPDNAPDAWEQAGLKKLSGAIDAGSDPARLEVSDVVNDDAGEAVFRYMKPIMTAPLCLTCHGEVIESSLSEELARRYPEDQATGYKTGEMRGAFSVLIPLEK